MLNERIPSFARLHPQLVKAEEALTKLPENTPFKSFAHKYVNHSAWRNFFSLICLVLLFNYFPVYGSVQTDFEYYLELDDVHRFHMSTTLQIRSFTCYSIRGSI